MASSERIKQVQEAIVTHLKTVGPHDWDEIQKDFLDIPTSSFWRYVKKAKEQLEKPIVSNVTTDFFLLMRNGPRSRENRVICRT
jgi:hypothetical protein